MLLQKGKSYRYIGGSTQHRGKIFKCKLIAPNHSGIRHAYFNMGYGTRSYHIDGRGCAYNKICWQEVLVKKTKLKTTSWK